MINLTYKDFLELIKQKRIFLMCFHVNNYNHYKYCVIRTTFDRVNSDSKIYLITCVLTRDESEKVSFYDSFKEDYKLFKFGKKGSFSLKTVWDKIVIDSIEN